MMVMKRHGILNSNNKNKTVNSDLSVKNSINLLPENNFYNKWITLISHSLELTSNLDFEMNV